MQTNRLHLVKLGSAIVDDEERLALNLKKFLSLPDPKILLHGGGKIASNLSSRLGLTPKFVDGRRITDQATLDIAIMVYAGLINKKIVSDLNAMNGSALGLCGADLKLIKSKKRPVVSIDFGQVGDVQEVNIEVFIQLFSLGWQPILSAITWSSEDGLLNTNADSLGGKLASAFAPHFEVSLQLISENSGVLMNLSDPSSLIAEINFLKYDELKNQGVISGGMIPKLDSAFQSLEQGIKEIWIAGEVVTSDEQHYGTKICRL